MTRAEYIKALEEQLERNKIERLRLWRLYIEAYYEEDDAVAGPQLREIAKAGGQLDASDAKITRLLDRARNLALGYRDLIN